MLLVKLFYLCFFFLELENYFGFRTTNVIGKKKDHSVSLRLNKLKVLNISKEGSIFLIVLSINRVDEWSLRAFASMPRTAIFLRARAEIKICFASLRATQKFGEHEQASTRLNFASKSSKGKILRAVKNLNGPFITPINLSVHLIYVQCFAFFRQATLKPACILLLVVTVTFSHAQNHILTHVSEQTCALKTFLGNRRPASLLEKKRLIRSFLCCSSNNSQSFFPF